MPRMLGACELCRGRLVGDGEAYICSYECTYCPACARQLDACPNGGGELVARPQRTPELAVRWPVTAADRRSRGDRCA